jgi:hypothetical protein
MSSLSRPQMRSAAPTKWMAARMDACCCAVHSSLFLKDMSRVPFPFKPCSESSAPLKAGADDGLCPMDSILGTY